jgi:hypothetical protein
MKMSHFFAVVALLGATASPAAAQNLTLEFQDGRVRLNAQDVSINQILAEWARRGRTTIVNGERVPGPPVTLELQDVSEREALDVILRGVSGYLVAARESSLAGASTYDRIYILATSSRPNNAAAAPQQPQPAFQIQEDDLDEDVQPPGPRGVNQPPGARLPRDIPQPGVAVRPVVPVDDVDEEPAPESRPGPAPNNPFGVAPGTNRPGVVTTPGPPNTRPQEP